MFIACLGLLGLADFTAERRRKEIGVRKVMGASVSAIVLLLSREFVQLVAVGFVVAVPVAYVMMSLWLDDFGYRISLGAEYFKAAHSSVELNPPAPPPTLVVAPCWVRRGRLGISIRHPWSSERCGCRRLSV